MAFSCGFYNAIDHDRSYSATQFGEMFDGLITDGVYSTIGECFMVVPGTGLGVTVKSGRAWFNKTWSVNTADLPLDLGMADLLLPRIDMVILEVDTRVAVRNNSIKVVTGTPAVTPQRPSIIAADGLYQYPLAYISVAANASQIISSDITVVVGQSPCPFVTGILESVPIDDMYQQWQGQFEEWFENLKAILEGDVVGNLLYQLGNKVDKADKATVEDALAGTDDTKWMTPMVTLEQFLDKSATSEEVSAMTDVAKWLRPSDLLGLSNKLGTVSGRVAKLHTITFTTTTSWTAPADLAANLIFCVLQGGGGGGGGGTSTSSAGSGAQGPIGFGIASISSSASYTITVGAGGAGGAKNTSGGTGGTTSAFSMSVPGGSGANTSSPYIKVNDYYDINSASNVLVCIGNCNGNQTRAQYEFYDSSRNLRIPFAIANGGAGGATNSSGSAGAKGRVILYYLSWS